MLLIAAFYNTAAQNTIAGQTEIQIVRMMVVCTFFQK